MIIMLSILASAGLSIAAIVLVSYPLNQRVYTTSTNFASTPFSHVAKGSIAVVLTMPNDLSDFLGRIYNFDCITADHTLVILPGTLVTTWTGVEGVRTATCLVAGAGFSFRVTSPSTVRLIDPINMSFT